MHPSSGGPGPHPPRTMSHVDTRGAVLFGSQEPTVRWSPSAYSTETAQECLDLVTSSGLGMDPWQEDAFTDALGEDERGLWVSNEFGLCCPRQQGKGNLIEARELSGIFVLGETGIIHSAHEFRTSASAFKRMKTRIAMNPDLDRRVTKISNSKGSEGFEFRIKTGLRTHTAELRYQTRTGGGGRGIPDMSLVVFDEAMILDDGPIAALLPTMTTQPKWQAWYLGSAGDVRLRTESIVFARLRRRGHRRESRLTWWEWFAHLKHDKGCPPDCVVDVRSDPRTFAKTCPALGRRIDEEKLRGFMGSMAAWDFDREFLGVGEWPKEDGWALFTSDAWEAVKDPASQRGRHLAVGIECEWDLSASSVSIASTRDDGFIHVECVRHAPGTTWVPEFCRELRRNKRPLAFLWDRQSPTNVLTEDMKAVKIEPEPVTLTDFAGWCSKMTTLVTEDRRLRHIGQLAMDTAVKVQTKRELSNGAFVWERVDQAAPVSPWISSTLAVGGLLRHGARPKGRVHVGSA